MLIKSAAAGSALALVAGVAGAQSLERWGETSGWDILINPTPGNGCLIQAEYNDGSLVRICFDHTQNASYVAVFNAAWETSRKGETYPVSFALEARSTTPRRPACTWTTFPGSTSCSTTGTSC